MAAKKNIILNPLVIALFEELKRRGNTVPRFADETGIPKDRVYKWKQEGTAPKEDDAKLIRRWIKMEEPPKDEFKGNEDINSLLGRIEERLLRIEAHLEVYENAIAGLQSKSNDDFPKKVGALRAEVQVAVNRRFDALQKKR